MKNSPPSLIIDVVLQMRKIYAWLLKAFKALSLEKKAAVMLLTIITLIISCRQLTYDPGYCSTTQHYHTDAELIEYSQRVLKAEAAHYGGIDEFEKELIRRKIHPEQAGRNFNPNDPNCCKVYRGASDTQRGCGTDEYPVCVILDFPPLKELPKGKIYYQREGRTYLFDDCGKLRKSWSIVG
ncbi:MAG: hypothetical protein Q8O81_14280 [Giesbergeria sp.]|nr:hypothetical protein [Giesbergeria sp.]